MQKGFWLQEQQIRHCHFHAGSSSSYNESLGDFRAPEVTSSQMLRALMAYIWPKDDEVIRKRWIKHFVIKNAKRNRLFLHRVVVSLSLLAGAKILNVCVPFLFKGAIDGLNVLQMGTPTETTFALISSMLIGCKFAHLKINFAVQNLAEPNV